MGIATHLDDVLTTQDGPWECYDTTVTAEDLYRLYKTGFLKLDPEAQRGEDNVTGKPVLDLKKIERWTEELIEGTAILGQLSWNFRKGETNLTYNEDERKLTVSAGAATIPDSYHRCRAIVAAAESYERGSTFDPHRRFSVRIFHVTPEEEKRIFYAYNQEGKPADAGRSKWLHPKEPAQRLAAELVRSTPVLSNNVDTVRDRLSKRNWRVASFGTISRAVEDAWGDLRLDQDDAFNESLAWLSAFWGDLVDQVPELGKLDLEERQRVREESLVDSANSLYALFHVARKMKDAGYPTSELARLKDTVSANGTNVPFLSRENPLWEQKGVLVTGERVRKDGTRTKILRNSRQARDAFIQAMLEQVGLNEPEPDEPDESKEATDSVTMKAPAAV